MKGANCQIFTPEKYVKKLLKLINYKNDVYGKLFLENSCGEGNILIEAVKVYINDCKKKKIPKSDIKKGLENDIEAFEIDLEKLEICKKNLNDLCEKYKIFDVNWNIHNEDALKFKYTRKYDFIVGNPPYISYRDLVDADRQYVKENFVSCKKGKFDYCYAFIESSINNLSETGKMAYLIPNSIFKNVFGKELRNIMKPYITEVYDNFAEKVFDNAIVSPSIIVLDKESKSNMIKYVNDTTLYSCIINKNRLVGKWIFSNQFKNDLSENIEKFSDNFIISNSIATLSNDSYIIKKWTDIDDTYIKCGDYLIEKELIRDAVSPSSMSKKLKYKIIFPYYYRNGNLCRYKEDEFRSSFPRGYEYLYSKKEKLDNRDADKGIAWFEYGRSQALKNMNMKKLMISIMVTGDIKVFEVDENTIPYSGIYIVKKNDTTTLNYAEEILKSDEFKRYCYRIGITSSEKSKRITCNDVKNYIIRR